MSEPFTHSLTRSRELSDMRALVACTTALYVRRKPRVRIEALQSGGGQERGIRSGTLPTQLVVGLGAACRIAKEEMQADSEWVRYLWNRLYSKLQQVRRCSVARERVHVHLCALLD